MFYFDVRRLKSLKTNVQCDCCGKIITPNDDYYKAFMRDEYYCKEHIDIGRIYDKERYGYDF